MNEVCLTMNESELRAALNVSKTTLWDWRKKGMPALSSGRPGVQNTYDAAAVVEWLNRTGMGHLASHDVHRRIVALQARVTAARDRAANPRVPAPVELLPRMQELTGAIFANSLIPAAGMAVHRYQLEPEVALNVYEDLLLVLMFVAADELGAEDFQVLFRAELAETLKPEARAGLLARIRATAATQAQGNATD